VTLVFFLTGPSSTLKTPMAGGKSSKGKRSKSSKGSKWKRPLTPLSKDFGDSEFSEEQLSSEGEESPSPTPQLPLSKDSEDSMGLSPTEMA
jgi:hypothetical protein